MEQPLDFLADPFNCPVDGVLLADCRKMLAEISLRYAGRPADEYRQLCLLALGREQLVSFAYSEQIIRQPLAQIKAPASIIDLFRYSLTQLWRDEEAHTNTFAESC